MTEYQLTYVISALAIVISLGSVAFQIYINRRNR